MSVQNPGDVQLSRALLQALGDRFEWFMLFAGPELKERMGEVDCKYGFDAPLCMLNARNFQLVISFAGLLHPGMMRNLLLLSFFNEVGIPTLEIQHGLFQYGINNIDSAPQVGAHPLRGDQLSMPIGYAARHVLPWAGPDGIGYPKSVLTPRPCSRRDGFVLITSNNHWQIYQAEHRRQFGLAVGRLVQSRPDLEFVWKPHVSEDANPETKQVLEALQNMNLPNLQIERAGDAEDLIPGCVAGVSSVSTTLLDYQMRQKPVLVYDAAPVRHLIERMDCGTFRGSDDVTEKLSLLLSAPERHLIETGVGPFAPERLASRFEQALTQARPARDHLPVALEYLQHQQAQRPVVSHADLDRAVAQVAREVSQAAGNITQEITHAQGSLGQFLAGMSGEMRQEAARLAADLTQNVAKVAQGLERASRKLTHFQRSTLAYKLKKAFKASTKRLGSRHGD